MAMLLSRRGRIMDRETRLAMKLIRMADHEARVEHLIKKYPKVRPETIKELPTADPTPNKIFLEWLVRQVLNGSLRWPEDGSRATEALTVYAKLKKSPRLLQEQGAHPDINKYNFGTLEDLKEKVQGVDLESRRKMEQKTKMAGAKQIYKDDKVTVIQIGGEGVDLNEAGKAACIYGKHTRWCTSNESTAKGYLRDGPLFVVSFEGQKICQSHPATNQLKDLEDHNISARNLPFQVLNVMAKLGALPDDYLREFAEGRNLKRVEDYEPAILQYLPVAIDYAKNVIGGRWPEAEEQLEKRGDAYDLYNYAVNVLGHRWPEVEEYISHVPVIFDVYKKKFGM